jgi:hypothetical protein
MDCNEKKSVFRFRSCPSFFSLCFLHIWAILTSFFTVCVGLCRCIWILARVHFPISKARYRVRFSLPPPFLTARESVRSGEESVLPTLFWPPVHWFLLPHRVCCNPVPAPWVSGARFRSPLRGFVWCSGPVRSSCWFLQPEIQCPLRISFWASRSRSQDLVCCSRFDSSVSHSLAQARACFPLDNSSPRGRIFWRRFGHAIQRFTSGSRFGAEASPASCSTRAPTLFVPISAVLWFYFST